MMGIHRITYGEWKSLGGLKNSDLMRKMVNGRWQYYAGCKV